jgi:signal transduction histidine kinase
VVLGSLAAGGTAFASGYDQPGGEVNIRTAPHQLRVSNTGPHLDDTTVQKLFEPFPRGTTPRVSNAADGTGLGLSIVDAIATAHHTTLTAHAKTAGGLTVDIGAVTVSGLAQAQDHRLLVEALEEFLGRSAG